MGKFALWQDKDTKSTILTRKRRLHADPPSKMTQPFLLSLSPLEVQRYRKHNTDQKKKASVTVISFPFFRRNFRSLSSAFRYMSLSFELCWNRDVLNFPLYFGWWYRTPQAIFKDFQHRKLILKQKLPKVNPTRPQCDFWQENKPWIKYSKHYQE